jgi:hypothetical protein
MKKVLFLVFLITFIHPLISAQNNKDVIYLKNGSIIYGTLIEISDNQYKIRSDDGSIFVFSVSEVEKFIKEPVSLNERKKNGPGLAVEAGFMLGSQTSDYPAPVSFNAMVTYTVETRNIISLGSGAEFLGKTYTPLFFEYKYLFYNRKVSQFAFFRTGVMLYLGPDEENQNYYYPLRKEYGGGASVTAGTGISWCGNGYETYLSFAYRYAHTNYVETDYNQQDVTYKLNYNRLEIKVGFKF